MSETTGQELSAFDKIEKVKEILDRNGRQSSRLIPILQEVQEVYRYLPKEIMNYVAQALGIPAGRVYGVATFYAHFALEPKGKYLIRLCDGTACHVRGSEPILAELRKKLGLTAQHPTSDDLMFTIETVSCLGACGLAPVVVINDEVHGQMTPDKALKLIDDVLQAEKA
ncbi:MAG: NAD(P)H-dependent oxidoreductase subunit E [Alphaproteobacteria bacterium]|nr:NAD(P)H-dependent oxidoreductase subunit E [Alphaproteobacteria bacterium]MBO4644609.1 NAD(P)H-dependent oxidoreductase subunit E [Alphaproteobacteria bacterium]